MLTEKITKSASYSYGERRRILPMIKSFVQEPMLPEHEEENQQTDLTENQISQLSSINSFGDEESIDTALPYQCHYTSTSVILPVPMSYSNILNSLTDSDSESMKELSRDLNVPVVSKSKQSFLRNVENDSDLESKINVRFNNLSSIICIFANILLIKG